MATTPNHGFIARTRRVRTAPSFQNCRTVETMTLDIYICLVYIYTCNTSALQGPIQDDILSIVDSIFAVYSSWIYCLQTCEGPHVHTRQLQPIVSAGHAGPAAPA